MWHFQYVFLIGTSCLVHAWHVLLVSNIGPQLILAFSIVNSSIDNYSNQAFDQEDIHEIFFLLFGISFPLEDEERDPRVTSPKGFWIEFAGNPEQDYLTFTNQIAETCVSIAGK